MQGSILFLILQFLVQLFGLFFAIRIISFKKDAWYFYFLATFIGFISFYNFSDFNLFDFIKSLQPFFHDLGLPILAIIIANKFNITPQKIKKNNLLQVSTITILATIFMIFFSYINLTTVPSYSAIMIISYFFGILVYVGSVLLAFGYISGLLLNAIFPIYLACMNIYFSISFGFFPSIYYLIVTVAFNILCFIIFTYGYNKNSKDLSE